MDILSQLAAVLHDDGRLGSAAGGAVLEEKPVQLREAFFHVADDLSLVDRLFLRRHVEHRREHPRAVHNVRQHDDRAGGHVLRLVGDRLHVEQTAFRGCSATALSHGGQLLAQVDGPVQRVQCLHGRVLVAEGASVVLRQAGTQQDEVLHQRVAYGLGQSDDQADAGGAAGAEAQLEVDQRRKGAVWHTGRQKLVQNAQNSRSHLDSYRPARVAASN